jgi:hypothetical protein
MRVPVANGVPRASPGFRNRTKVSKARRAHMAGRIWHNPASTVEGWPAMSEPSGSQKAGRYGESND